MAGFIYKTRTNWAALTVVVVWLLSGLVPGPGWYQVARLAFVMIGLAICFWLAYSKDRADDSRLD